MVGAGRQGFARRFVLLASVFVVAACGLVYELVAGAVSSYLMGDAVTQFSLVIGVFLCAMGVGSYLARFVQRDLLHRFIEIEIWIGLIGGGSSIAIFAVSAFLPGILEAFFYTLCGIIGTLVGMEIPILVRIVHHDVDVESALSNVLALDYLGALAGSILFPLAVLPVLGLSRASVVFGVLNLAVALAGIRLVQRRRRALIGRWVVAAALLLALLGVAGRLVGALEDLLYQDSVVFATSTRHQRIVVTRWRDDVRLYLNGHLQFCSIDEPRYHESLVIPAMEAAGRPASVLILGGGDGLALREVLKYPSVSSVTLVDIDAEMVRIARTRPEFLRLNKGSLSDPRVQTIYRDAMKFLEESRAFFDVIVCDLPDPNSETLAKLYSTAFYALCARRLSERGVLVTQATSPFFARDAFWCIHDTIAAAVRSGAGAPRPLEPRPYHVNVPSFGEWGFVMAARWPIDPESIRPSVETRFLTADLVATLFAFGKDLLPASKVVPNRLDDPTLFRYYQLGWLYYN